MKFGKIAIASALAAVLALPVLAQTTQTAPAKPTPAITTAPKQAAAASSAPVDINSASAADLDALPGIGKARAAAIIKGRPYNGKDDLLNRHILTASVYKGIKDKIVARQK